MRTNRQLTRLALVLGSFSLACGGNDAPGIAPLNVDAVTAVLARGADARPVKLNHHAIVPIWTVSKDEQAACGGPVAAGGQVGGRGNFTHLGESAVDVSVAWDVGHLIQTPARYRPVGPAGGPVAPVVGPAGYPFPFAHDPYTGNCAQTVAATGQIVLTAANGDQLYGKVAGGEAHRLDFIIPGDGVESFIEVDVTGGSGRLTDATGAFVVHTIARLTPSLRFAVTLAEILPGGTLGY